MQSAEEFIKYLRASSDDWEVYAKYGLEESVDLIRARDREIIEACKTVIMADAEPFTMTRNDYVCELLDSILLDLG